MATGGLPTGTVTFLLTDVEGSTRMWEAEREEMAAAMARHDALAEEVITRAGGHLLKARGEGDALFCVFGRAVDAVAATAELQQSIAAEPWPTSTPLRVRIAVHVGDAELRDNDYFGPVVNRAARLRGIGHGGQTVLSGAVATLTSATLPPRAELVDLGMHRLKDLSEPEHVFELRLDGGEVHPPLRSLDWLPTNLPRLRTSFVGRDREAQSIRQALTNGSLVTLTGAGGTGKTRLALQVAASFVGERPDGVWLVELAAVSDPAEIAAAVGSVVGARSEDMATLLAHLETRDMIVVLDNCEHVIEAAADLADTLLARCRAVTILATSREPLGIPGEAVIRLPTLSDADARELLRDRMGTDAPTDQVERLCRAVDGIPLAIELAAARAATLGLATVVDRLDDLFVTRRGGTRGAQSRQRTLEATVGWSHDLLTPVQQRVFRRLSVFVGGFDLAAADAVVDDVDVFAEVVALVDQSLVEPVGDGRYRLLEPLRHYGADRLADATEIEGVRDRHLHWFLARVVDGAERQLRSGPDHATDVSADLDNIAAAFQWALARQRTLDAATIAIDLSGGSQPGLTAIEATSMLRQVLATDPSPGVRAITEYRHEHFHNQVRATSDLLPALPDDPGLPPRWRLEHDLDRAYTAWPHEAVPLLAELQATAEGEGAEAYLARLHAVRGRVLGDTGDRQAARAAHDEAVRRARLLDSPLLLTSVLWESGYDHWRAGDFAEAERVSDQRLELLRPLATPSLMVAALNMAAYVRAPRDPQGATALIEEAVALARTLPDRMELCDVLHSSGELHIAAENWSTAEERLTEGLHLARRLDLGALQVGCAADLAWCVARRDPAAAARSLAELLQPAPRFWARATRRLAGVASLHGAHETAAVLYGFVERSVVELGADRPVYDRYRSVTVEALGGERFEELRRSGEELGMETLSEVAGKVVAAINAHS